MSLRIDHVHSCGLGSADDEAIWEYARREGFTIVSKDSDFQERRRKRPIGIVVHRADPSPGEITTHEGMPITTVERTIGDILVETGKVDLARRAIGDARRQIHQRGQSESAPAPS